MVTDVVGMVQGASSQRRFTSAAELARALTAMQIGLELLEAPARLDRAGLDRRTLLRAIITANEQVQRAAAALMPATTHPPSPRT